MYYVCVFLAVTLRIPLNQNCTKKHKKLHDNTKSMPAVPGAHLEAGFYVPRLHLGYAVHRSGGLRINLSHLDIFSLCKVSSLGVTIFYTAQRYTTARAKLFQSPKPMPLTGHSFPQSMT